jgi:hypothetical protein
MLILATVIKVMVPIGYLFYHALYKNKTIVVTAVKIAKDRIICEIL